MNTNVQQGDWLIPHNCEEPHQIKEISYQEEPAGKWPVITFEGKGFLGVWYYPQDCKPVPITKEVLKKNGFTDGKYRHFNGNVWKLEADGFREIHLTEKVRQAVLWGEKINPDYPSSVGDKFTIPFIRNVHELQHAMRLCGIEKEIVI